MRKYKPAFGKEIDLDNPKTYSFLPKTKEELRNLMFREIGYAIVYMDFFPDRKKYFPKNKQKSKMVKMSDMFPNAKYPNKKIDINNSSYNQRQRIYKLIKYFAENENKYSYTEDKNKKLKNLMWYKEQVFLFQDETENMC